VLAGVAGLFAYSKRETLRLASELNRARAEGAASFDKLDTCIASYGVAQREAASCRDARSKDEADFKAALGHVARSGGASEAAMSRQMQALESAFTTRLRSCEDDAEIAAKQRERERERLASECQSRESELSSERDDQRKVAEARAGELERCRADLGEARAAQEKAASRAPTVPVGASLPTSPSAGSPSASMGTPVAPQAPAPASSGSSETQ
jgi:hypothetical protein